MYDSYDILTCSKDDLYFPQGMKNLQGMPPLIYYRGNIDIINTYKNVAVIGSRKSSAEGLRRSYNAGKLAAKLNINVVNGLALGCDTEALKRALSVGGKCIAVCPVVWNKFSRSQIINRLRKYWKKGGCLISQYLVGTTVRAYQYVERDKLQSGISQGVVIIESQEKSGTMHTADFAIRQYKRLACYYSKLVNCASGNKRLEDMGKAKVLMSEDDLQRFLIDIVNDEEYEQLTLELN